MDKKGLNVLVLVKSIEKRRKESLSYLMKLGKKLINYDIMWKYSVKWKYKFKELKFNDIK